MKKLLLSLLIPAFSFAQDTIQTTAGKTYAGKITIDNGNDLCIIEKGADRFVPKTKILYTSSAGTRKYFDQEKMECERTIEKKVDKFTGDIIYNSEHDNEIRYYKFISVAKKDTNYYVCINVKGIEGNYSESVVGAYILFESGEKFMREDAKVDCKFQPGGKYMYSAMVKIKKDQLHLFQSPITDCRLYIYDAQIAKEQSLRLNRQLKCLIGS